ncbi:TorD/DmsD family molecular chaperone [Raoultibacter phocaeensis]|uniref:TorD/DmsD family molecular chaperone n=1 Tax=Raoultibacter phocaeensis TaxID=2479841 RepID=UPI00111802D7|nr:molecular chaperone TorD family protein [Raoultibacter phocaeensis]
MQYCTDIELKQLSSARYNTYSLLARVWGHEADEALWESLVHLASELHGAGVLAVDGYGRLARYTQAHSEAPLSELAVDYTATLLGFGPRREGAYPYESVYTSNEGLMRQEALDTMVSILRAEHLTSTLPSVVDDDHLATELAFLAYRSKQVLHRLAQGDSEGAWLIEEQRASFLYAHPLRWMLLCCSDVERLAQTDFYRAFAEITREFLTFDEEATAAFGFAADPSNAIGAPSACVG